MVNPCTNSWGISGEVPAWILKEIMQKSTGFSRWFPKEIAGQIPVGFSDQISGELLLKVFLYKFLNESLEDILK